MSAAANRYCPHGMPSPRSCVDCMYETGVGGDPAEAVTVEFTFAAKFPGDCSGCNLPVTVGQSISRLSNGRYVHEGCE